MRLIEQLISKLSRAETTASCPCQHRFQTWRLRHPLPRFPPNWTRFTQPLLVHCIVPAMDPPTPTPPQHLPIQFSDPISILHFFCFCLLRKSLGYLSRSLGTSFTHEKRASLGLSCGGKQSCWVTVDKPVTPGIEPVCDKPLWSKNALWSNHFEACFYTNLVATPRVFVRSPEFLILKRNGKETNQRVFFLLFRFQAVCISLFVRSRASV